MPEEQQQQQASAPRTFTQDEVNAFLADDRRKTGEKFADYDDLKAKASRLDEIEQASKTELQKAIDRAEAAERKAADLEGREQRRTWADEVSAATGVPASVLKGATKDEIQSHADALKALMQPVKQSGSPLRLGTHGSGVGGGELPEGKGRAAAAVRALRAQ